MAHYCPDCKLVFEARKAICPQCGYCGVDDDRPDQFYLDQGFSRFGGAARRSDPPSAAQHLRTASGQIPAAKIDDADLIAQLRAGIGSYRDGPNDSPSKDAQTDAPACTRTRGEGDDFFGGYAGHRTQTPQPQRPAEPTAPSATGSDDFFGAYRDTPPRRPETPRPSVSGGQPAEPRHVSPQPADSDLYRVPGAAGNTARRFFSGLGSFLVAVPWRAVFSVLLVVSVLAGLYGIWQMRAVILSSILNFLLGLAPAVLMIAGIVWMLRSMFR